MDVVERCRSVYGDHAAVTMMKDLRFITIFTAGKRLRKTNSVRSQGREWLCCQFVHSGDERRERTHFLIFLCHQQVKVLTSFDISQHQVIAWMPHFVQYLREISLSLLRSWFLSKHAKLTERAQISTEAYSGWTDATGWTLLPSHGETATLSC